MKFRVEEPGSSGSAGDNEEEDVLAIADDNVGRKGLETRWKIDWVKERWGKRNWENW